MQQHQAHGPVVLGHVFRRIPEDVPYDAHRRLGGIDEGVADHELFEDVVLDGALEEVLLHTLLFRCSYIPGTWADRRGSAALRSVPTSMLRGVMSKRANKVTLDSFLSISAAREKHYGGDIQSPVHQPPQGCRAKLVKSVFDV